MANQFPLFEPIFDKLMSSPRSARAREALESSVAGILDELLEQRGAPGKAELAAAQQELQASAAALQAQGERIAEAEQRLTALRAQIERQAQLVHDLGLDLSDARVAQVQAEARADETAVQLREALRRIDALEAAPNASAEPAAPAERPKAAPKRGRGATKAEPAR